MIDCFFAMGGGIAIALWLSQNDELEEHKRRIKELESIINFYLSEIKK